MVARSLRRFGGVVSSSDQVVAQPAPAMSWSDPPSRTVSPAARISVAAVAERLPLRQ
jgi:hypothetical protein